MQKLANGLVHGTQGARPYCYHAIKKISTITGAISLTTCCVKKLNICLAQNADVTVQLLDADSVDYSTATELTFDIWDKRPGAAGATNKYSVSLTGGGITLPSTNIWQFTIADTDSGAMNGNNWCEAWATLSGGEQVLVGAGVVEVRDTRKHD